VPSSRLVVRVAAGVLLGLALGFVGALLTTSVDADPPGRARIVGPDGAA